MTRGPNRNSDAPSSAAWGARNKSAATATTADSSAEHRRKLEALFGGGASAPAGNALAPARAPEREKVFSSPRKSTGRAPSEYRLRLERLRAAREVEEIREAADAFLGHHQLPDDPDILYKLLQHPTEKVVREALGQISSLLIQGRVSNTVLLENYLGALTERVVEASTRSYVDGIRAQVAQLKK
ncbi:MAG: hypothetical protein HY903_20750 [Deltaproteobacteria bacterium]|nr:hypothetical protein [Deltaproteobacteria bacterium]